MTPTSTSFAARIARIDSLSAPASSRADGRLANTAEAAGKLSRTVHWLTGSDDVEEERDALPRSLRIRVGDLAEAFDDESGLRQGVGVGLQRPVLAVECHVQAVVTDEGVDVAHRVEVGTADDEWPVRVALHADKLPSGVDGVHDREHEMPAGSEDP